MEYTDHLPRLHVEMLSCMAAFAVVVETGSFTDASLKLGVTASAVSKQISRLESVLSIRLLERSTRQLKVNAEGAEIYSHCRELLDSSASVFKLKDRFLEKPQGLIRLVVPKSFHRACNNTLPDFLRMYPDINVQLISNDGNLDFISDSIDIGIKITDNPPLGLVARKLFPVDYMLCASLEYAGDKGLPLHPSELVNHSCIPVAPAFESETWSFLSENEKCEVKISGRYYSDGPESSQNAAMAGLGISCLPSKLATEAIANKQLFQVLPGWKYQGPNQGMAWLIFQSGKHLSQKTKLMVEHLSTRLRALGGL